MNSIYHKESFRKTADMVFPTGGNYPASCSGTFPTGGNLPAGCSGIFPAGGTFLAAYIKGFHNMNIITVNFI